MLYTLYELVQLCLPVITGPHLNGLSRLVWRSPSGAQRESFQTCIFQSCHFKKKKNVLPPCSSGKCHAILPRVGGNAATAVVKEEPQLTNQREARLFFFFRRIDVQTIHLENETERKEKIKCNRCNRICADQTQYYFYSATDMKLSCSPFMEASSMWSFCKSTMWDLKLLSYTHLWLQ